MKIAVLGTGAVGQALAGRLSQLGHSVVVGTRDPKLALARIEPDRMGKPAFGVWHQEHWDVGVQAYMDAAAGAELLVLAGLGSAAIEMLNAAGAANLAGKVLVDVTNPLDFSAGFPPRLFVLDVDSLGEQIQRAFPAVKVVKALNTYAAEFMVEPSKLGASSSVFISGGDATAKRTVAGLLQSFGHTDVIDLGGIASCRGTEMLGQLWMRVYAALGTDAFGFRIVRR